MFYRNINDDSKSVLDIPSAMLQLVASFMIVNVIKYRPLVYRNVITVDFIKHIHGAK
jgi:hypothetical protein